MNARLLIIAAVAASSTACFGGIPIDPPPCSGALAAACRKAENLAALVGIAYADAVAGGSPFLGEANTHGPRRVALQLRGNTVKTSMPNSEGITYPTDGSIGGSAVPTTDISTTALSAELAVGVLRGLPVGTNHVFGVDLLGGVSVLRDYSGSGMSATAAMNSSQLGNWNHGSSLGIRIGLTEERALVPGLSLTFVTRRLPKIQVNSRGNGSGSGELVTVTSDLDVRDAGWRLVASKTIRSVGLSVGSGADDYDIASNNSVALTARTNLNGRSSADAQFSRRNIFASAFTNIGVAKVVGEAGLLSGGRLSGMSDPLNRDPAGSHGYFTLGLRIGK